MKPKKINKKKTGPKPKSEMERKHAISVMVKGEHIELLGGFAVTRQLLADHAAREAKKIKLETN